VADLQPSSPFGSLARTFSGAGLAIEFLPGIAALALQAHRLDEVAAAAVAAASGVTLPGAPNTVSGGARRWLWVGRGEWFLIDDRGLDGVADRIAQALTGVPHVVTKLGSAMGAIRLSGAAARVLLSRACPIDLHPTRFPVGTCARTLLDPYRVTLHLRDPEPLYELLVDVSLARSAAAWLLDAAAEFG
jgi:sarcosine oxidase, subunit gamma